MRVSVELMPGAVGVSDAGAKAQVTPVGCPVQLSAVVLLKPFSDVSVIGTVSVLD